jgi:hypothetical protein
VPVFLVSWKYHAERWSRTGPGTTMRAATTAAPRTAAAIVTCRALRFIAFQGSRETGRGQIAFKLSNCFILKQFSS